MQDDHKYTVKTRKYEKDVIIKALKSNRQGCSYSNISHESKENSNIQLNMRIPCNKKILTKQQNNPLKTIVSGSCNNRLSNKNHFIPKSLNFNKIDNENIFDKENIKKDISSIDLNDTSSLIREVHELSAEIAQLQFHPHVYKMIKNSKIRKLKQINQITNKEIGCNDGLIIADENSNSRIISTSCNKTDDNLNKVMNINEKLDVTYTNCIKETSNVLNSMLQDDLNKKEELISDQEPVKEDYTDLINLTFCKYEKTSSVSTCTPTDDELMLKNETVHKTTKMPSSDYTDIANRITLKPISRLNRKRKVQLISNNETTTDITQQPDLTSHNLDEIEESTSPNASKTDVSKSRNSFRNKLRQIFHSSDHVSSTPKSKNNVISKKRTSKNRMKNFSDKLKSTFTPHPKQIIYLPDLNFPVTPIKDGKNCPKIQELIQQLKIQQTIIQQASKALTLCHNVKEFTGSEAEIESEKSILLGNVRTKATLDEIDRLMLYEKSQISKSNIESDICGDIQIKCIELLLKRKAVHELLRKNQTEYFVIVITHKLFVWASKIFYNAFDNLNVVIPQKISISDVNPDFKIKLQIYSMKLENSDKLNPDSKYIMNGKFDKMRRSSSNRFLRKFSCSNRSKKLEILPLDTQFELVGQLDLTVEDLYLKSPWPLSEVPKTTTLQSCINLNLSCKINLPIYHSGFVNHGSTNDGYTAWNRRWCILQDHFIQLWNSEHQENEQPILVIDLMNCILLKVKDINQKNCTKPTTLIIETVSKKTNLSSHQSLNSTNYRKIYRNLLSVGTNEELNEWISYINQTLSHLSNWNKTLYEEAEIEKTFYE